jgi:aldehyde:ferredoxin oxidoreductase
MKGQYLYAGKILWVDLTQKTTWTTPTAVYAQRFLGGKGIGARVLWEKSGLPSLDPLGPDNALSFDTGPLTGTLMPGSGRSLVSGKSPITGLLGTTHFGGSFAPELKYAGYDHVVVTGQATEPVYLAIDDEEVTIRSAANIWGLDTYETPKALFKELKNDQIKWVCIGLAGERLVRFATILGDRRDSTGGAGLGAVMGSKKLKALAVHGTGGLRVANPKRFYEMCMKSQDVLKASDITRPFQTFRSGTGRQKICCPNCPMCCMEDYHIQDIGDGDIYYQWYADLARKIGVHDIMMGRILALSINKYGYDITSLGDMIVWAARLYERSILTDRDIGFSLTWGDGEAYLKLSDMIVRREGLGDLLAEGPLRAARAIGYASGQDAICKEDWQGFLLGDGLSAKEINRSRFAFPAGEAGNVERTVFAEDAIGRADLLGTCKWHTEINGLPVTAEVHAEVLSIGLGKKITTDELGAFQRRLRHLERAFNCREGVRRQQDPLPDPCFSDSGLESGLEDKTIDRDKFEAMKNRYNTLRGWNLKTGVPTRATLESLDLKDVADELERRSILPGPL